MPKDTIREEWIYKAAHLDLSHPNDVHEAADWIIQKMEAHTADLAKRIEGMKFTIPPEVLTWDGFERKKWMEEIAFNSAIDKALSLLSPSSDNEK